MNKKLLATAIAASFVLVGCNDDDDDNNTDTALDLTKGSELIRLATTPLGAELTGMFTNKTGDFFFNIQHPSTSLAGDEAMAAVGVWTGIDIQKLDPEMESMAAPALGSADAETTKVATGTYQVLGRQGDAISGLAFPLGDIVSGDESVSIKSSPNPDFNAFVATNDAATQGYLYTAWEDRPGAVSRMTLEKLESGEWSVADAMNVDFSAVNGTMINCFGTLSPWGTPLTSEENYEAENAINWNNPAYTNGYPSYGDVQNIQTYLGGTFPNPYDYGYIVEITNPTSADPEPVKLFTMGRTAHENAVIMPDDKTVYLTDDGTDKVFYKFVADTAGDMSAGTLYAAKVTMDADGESMDLSWMELGSSNNTEIASWIREYDGIDESDYVDGETSYISDDDIAAYVAGTSDDVRAAFIETHRAAKAKGATAEFRKMEGININYDAMKNGGVENNFMWVAMSSVERGMSDGEGDIQVEENKCGIVYKIIVDENYDATRMEPAVVGGPYDSAASENKCAIDNIANPDNVVVLDDGRVLIGEDTGNHENNMLWLYNPFTTE